METILESFIDFVNFVLGLKINGIPVSAILIFVIVFSVIFSVIHVIFRKNGD